MNVRAVGVKVVVKEQAVDAGVCVLFCKPSQPRDLDWSAVYKGPPRCMIDTDGTVDGIIENVPVLLGYGHDNVTIVYIRVGWVRRVSGNTLTNKPARQYHYGDRDRQLELVAVETVLGLPDIFGIQYIDNLMMNCCTFLGLDLMSS